jgi:hypothetical protein
MTPPSIATLAPNGFAASGEANISARGRVEDGQTRELFRAVRCPLLGRPVLVQVSLTSAPANPAGLTARLQWAVGSNTYDSPLDVPTGRAVFIVTADYLTLALVNATGEAIEAQASVTTADGYSDVYATRTVIERGVAAAAPITPVAVPRFATHYQVLPLAQGVAFEAFVLDAAAGNTVGRQLWPAPPQASQGWAPLPQGSVFVTGTNAAGNPEDFAVLFRLAF